MAFIGPGLVQCNLVLNRKIINQVKQFKFLCVSLSLFDEVDFTPKYKKIKRNLSEYVPQ